MHSFFDLVHSFLERCWSVSQDTPLFRNLFAFFASYSVIIFDGLALGWYGRYDIQLLPNDITMHGIIMELKVIKEDVAEDNIEEALAKSANTALEQIDKKQYITEMKRLGVSKFLKIGVAFHKKHVQVVYSEE